MSSINRIGQTTPPVQTTAPKSAGPTTETTKPTYTRAADRLELSGVSHLLGTLKTNDVRADKVANIKAQIDAGTYESDDKLDAATDKLLDEILK